MGVCPYTPQLWEVEAVRVESAQAPLTAAPAVRTAYITLPMLASCPLPKRRERKEGWGEKYRDLHWPPFFLSECLDTHTRSNKNTGDKDWTE